MFFYTHKSQRKLKSHTLSLSLSLKVIYDLWLLHEFSNMQISINNCPKPKSKIVIVFDKSLLPRAITHTQNSLSQIMFSLLTTFLFLCIQTHWFQKYIKGATTQSNLHLTVKSCLAFSALVISNLALSFSHPSTGLLSVSEQT